MAVRLGPAWASRWEDIGISWDRSCHHAVYAAKERKAERGSSLIWLAFVIRRLAARNACAGTASVKSS